jgi:hypothetical protein
LVKEQKMPDGDQLNWKVRGQGSRRVLGLVRSGACFALVADEVVRMFVRHANAGNWKLVMRDMANAIGVALKQSNQHLTREADFARRAAAFDLLSRRLERIVAAFSDDSVWILVRAAIRTFGALEGRDTPATVSGIEQEFLSKSMCALLEARVLQPTRDELAREAHRSACEQNLYERELFLKVGEMGKLLQAAMFGEQNGRPIRAPRRSVPRKATTLERLGESLSVLGMEGR